MLPFGDLEKRIMDALWTASAPLTSSELRDALAESDAEGRELAQTTVLTVLSRLEDKGFVLRARDTRPHRYRPAHPRADFVAELMHDVLSDAHDREAVLSRFVRIASPDDAAALRRMLNAG